MSGFNTAIRHLLVILVAMGFVIACGPAEEEEAAEDDDRPHAGTEVQIFGAFVDEDARRFEENFEEFEEETGISVTYEGSGDFESLINVRADGGDPPDIGMFPQPGLLRDLVEQDHIIDLDEWFDESVFEEAYSESQLEQMEWDGQKAGFWFSNNAKSLVWYAKPAFEEEGYEIPETWDEMLDLSEQMIEDGYTPWSIGMESSGTTGWVGTDWIEDIMLRTAG
ncbi:MAG: ABC transporter substrate-binding protein, partial [Spirochaetales bacterium]